MNNIVIIGPSGHGSVVLDCIEKENKYNLIGFVDSFKNKGFKQNGYEVLGTENELPYLIEKYNLIGGIVAIGDNWTRSKVVEKVSKIAPSFQFITTIHPNTIIGKNVTIDEGTVIIPGAIVNANSFIGKHSIINTKSTLGHHGYMSEFTSLASGVCTGGNFALGAFSAISLGANIIENITIGPHTVVGAGSLVIKDFENHLMVHGNPAQAIRTRRTGERYLAGAVKPALERLGASTFF
ncbi:MAG: NeuD/PglB/VioB family sugar acetyltransferase [Eudoraea sp.]|nr:NeuD/PglB/VioB family sugar acetyltransferase [Eudoraea sp.]